MAERDADRPEMVIVVEEYAGRPEIVHDNLRPAGLLLGRDPVHVAAEQKAGWPEDDLAEDTVADSWFV